MHMRDILIVLGMCVAAIAVGVFFYVYGPAEMQQAPVDVSVAALPEQMQESSTIAQDVTITILDAGTNAGAAPERKNVAAYDTEGFTRLWKMAHGTDGTPAPSIDFSKHYAIGVFAGTKSSGGYSIEVSGVRDSGDTRTVAITLTKPGVGCLTNQALTSPYQIVTVPISTAVLSRKENTVEAVCE